MSNLRKQRSLSRLRRHIEFARLGISAVFLYMLSQGCAPRAVGPPGDSAVLPPVISGERKEAIHQFRVTNPFDQTVRILDAVASCACTRHDLDRNLLKPGESAVLTLAIGVPHGVSDRSVSCTLKTNYSEFPDWVYRLNVKTYPNRLIEPRIIDLGVLDETTAARILETQLDCYYRPPNAAPTISSIRASNALIEVHLSGLPRTELVEGGISHTRYPLSVRVKWDGSSGAHTEPVEISLSDGTKASAEVVWRCKNPINCMPSFAHFGVIRPSQAPATYSITIRAVSNVPFRVVSVDGGMEGMTVRLLDGEAGKVAATSHRLELRLSVAESESAPAVSGEAIIKTDYRNFPEVRIPWSAFVERPLQ